MKFLFLASRDWLHPEAAGGDLYIGNLARTLSRQGNDVILVSASHDKKPYRKTMDGVQMIGLPGGYLYALRLWKQLFLLRKRSDIVVEEMFGGKGFPPLARFLTRKPVLSMWYQRHKKIFCEQYPRFMALTLSVFERLVALLYKTGTIITLSKKSADELVEIGIRRSQMHIVPSAAVLIPPRKELLPNFKQRQDSMIFIGKIRKYKRIDHAIMALSKIPTNTMIPRLVIAGNLAEGEDDYLNHLRSLSEKLGIGHLVDFKIFPGMIPLTDKVELLSNAKVLLQTSPVEGFSMTTVEANMCGTPVVVSDGVPVDVVVPEKNGLVYSFGDVDGLAKCCTELLENETAWKQFSSQSLEMATRFSWDRSVDSFLSVARKTSSPHTVGE